MTCSYYDNEHGKDKGQPRRYKYFKNITPQKLFSIYFRADLSKAIKKHHIGKCAKTMEQLKQFINL